MIMDKLSIELINRIVLKTDPVTLWALTSVNKKLNKLNYDKILEKMAYPFNFFVHYSCTIFEKSFLINKLAGE